MGHLLSKNGYRLKKRTRKLRKKKRKRNCLLQGPCMLCFIVHGNSGSPDDEPLETSGGGSSSAVAASAVSASASKLAERYASSLGSPEACAHFLLAPHAELALLTASVPAKLLGPPSLFRPAAATVAAASVAVPTPPSLAEMVCKRKCAELQRCTPCKQPRCAFPESAAEGGGATTGGGGASAAADEAAAHRLRPLCSLPSSSSTSSSSSSASSSSSSSSGEDTLGAVLLGDRTSPASECSDASCINHLPSSILLKVFSHLTVRERCLGASLVCKYWRDLCLDFQFWKHIDLSGLQQVNDELLVKIASRRQNVTEVNISDCRNVQDHGVCSLASQSAGLLKYTAYRCKQLSDLSLCTIATHCPLLAKIHVGNQDKLTDHALKLLGQHCSELKDVHLGQCYNISDEGMVALATGCPKLQRIYMQENKLVTDKSVRAFAEHCPELQFVGFMGCSVTSQGVIHLTGLRNLSSLDLRHISELNNETVMEVVRKCRNLSSLNLCLNWSINDRCVEIIAKEGRRLKELYLVSCKITDYALIAIGQYSSSIETVDAGWCKDITDQGATQIAKSSKSLRYLGLMRCDKIHTPP
ncbi:F-box/LRR-repeat protein 17 [Clupea harengus]|uniref:F-box/LRR-repeat protein 17 n=1 Tax=Clupea harengus TaxID=7950 RepID=A0A6P8FIN3_CLUHA|nr:F-box/LRR-repeat protein 17 [Clupea harengus]